MAYIGAEPVPGQNREVDDISSGFNGNATAFTLQVSSVNVSPESANNILINLGGVLQNPGTDYTIAASTITFTTAPAAGLSFFGLILGAGINTATVADDTIGASKLIDTAVTAGSYTTADITVDAQGRITAAANGTIATAEIADGAVNNAKVNASAAIAGTKISPDFGSQNIVTTGSISGAAGTFTGDLSIPDKIVHTGDTHTAMRFTGNDTIAFDTGGTSRVQITDATTEVGNDLSLADTIVHTGDTNTKIRFPVADTISFNTGGDERARIGTNGALSLNYAADGDNNLHIGITSNSTGIALKAPGNHFSIIDGNSNRSSAGNTLHTHLGRWNGTQVASISFVAGSDTTNKDDGLITFSTSSADNLSEKVRIDSSGRMGIGTSSMGSYNNNSDNFVIRSSGTTGMTISGSTGGDCQLAFSNGEDTGVEGILTYQHGSNEFLLAGIESDSTLAFRTGNDKRMIIDSSGLISLATTTTANARLFVNPNVDGSTQRGITISGRRDVYDVIAINFVHATNNSSAGSVQFTTTAAVQYVTSSDYRLKQDVVTLTNSITKLKQLNPVHFKWKDMPSVETDGFLAHEVQTIVPSAIIGEKDAVDKDGNIEAQQIDTVKLTPLLTSALQEAIAKIETLETKVAALEAA